MRWWTRPEAGDRRPPDALRLGRVAAAVALGLSAMAFGAPVAVQQAAPWTPPLGIPTPRFGITETAPPRPSPWTSPVSGYYYVAPAAEGASDLGNPFGTPARPRATVPTHLAAGSVVELHGVYDLPRDSPGVRAEGTAERPVFIRSERADDPASITEAWQVSGSYLILEHLRFKARDRERTGSLVILSPADHVVLRHSEISGNLTGGGLGIESWFGLSAVSDVVIWDNKVHDNGDVSANFDQDRHGIHVGTRVSRVWVVDNEMWRNSGDGIQINAGNALLQSMTHHIYVGRNISHHNKQNGFWTKQAVDVVFSQNTAYANRPSNSSMGVGLGFQYAPSYVWFLFNHVYDSDYGIGTGSDSGLGTGTESFYIGNLIHGIHDSTGHFKAGSAWQTCGISLAGGVNRYVVNNTIYDADSGICSPGVTGRVELHDNIVFGMRPQGHHVFLEFPAVAVASKANGNLFGPDYRAMTAGVPHDARAPRRAPYPGNVVAAAPRFDPASRPAFDLQADSPAIDIGSDDPGGVYALFEKRYGLDIRRDFLGRPRPRGRHYDAGAFERQQPSTP